jgi:hypothetical protein
VRANNFADSLSAYSKHSDDMGGHGTEVEGKSKLSGMFSQKKGDNKFLKTQKKLPDL